MEHDDFMVPMENLVTDLTDSKEVADLLKGVQHAAEMNFKESGGDLAPVCIFTKAGKLGVMDLAQGMQSQDTKDGVAAVMRDLRRDCPAVVFVSEVWMSLPISPPKKPEGMSREEFMRNMEKNITPPSLDPNRKEAVMLTLYVGKDSHCFINMINREGGPHLEGWKSMPSTKNQSPDGFSNSGRFA